MFYEHQSTGKRVFLTLLTPEVHRSLLREVEQFPLGDGQATVYRKSIAELYHKYSSLLAEITETLATYSEVAEQIKSRQPLNNGRRYVRVRKALPADHKNNPVDDPWSNTV